MGELHFTLIELLVVIAIIAILIGLLLPSILIVRMALAVQAGATITEVFKELMAMLKYACYFTSFVGATASVGNATAFGGSLANGFEYFAIAGVYFSAVIDLILNPSSLVFLPRRARIIE